MATYSQEFKEKMVAKLLHPEGLTVIQLSKDSGVSRPTLNKWLKKFRPSTFDTRGTKSMTTKDSKMIRPQNWSAEAKLNAVIQTSTMTEEAIGSYCREYGLYSHHLEQWRKSLIDGLKPSIRKEQKAENVKLQATIKALRSDLNRKEKALAETSALLVLKKKAHLIWGGDPVD